MSHLPYCDVADADVVYVANMMFWSIFDIIILFVRTRFGVLKNKALKETCKNVELETKCDGAYVNVLVLYECHFFCQ